MSASDEMEFLRSVLISLEMSRPGVVPLGALKNG
jgi:hypothetical protein